MSLNSNKIENTTFSLKYYDTIKKLNNNYLNYIKTYSSITKEFYEKMSILQIDYKVQMKDILLKMDINIKKNIEQIIYYINVFPNIFNLYKENLALLINKLDDEIKQYDNFVKEKEMLINKFKTQFEEAKNDFLKKETNVDKLKVSFLDSIASSEKTIYKYYWSKKYSNKSNNLININLNILNQNAVTDEQLNNSISNTQRLENSYKDENESCKIYQDTYIQLENSSSENIKKIVCDLSEKLKSFITYILIPLKNSFKIPEKEIDSYLSEIVSIKGNKIGEIMNNFFKENNIEKNLYIPTKYDLDILKNEKYNKDSNKKNSHKNKLLNLHLFGNKNESALSKVEKKVIYIQDGLEEMPFIIDEIALLTIKKMLGKFKLVNDGGFKIDIEEEKTKTKNLSIKITSDFEKPKKNKNINNNNNIINEIDEEEDVKKKNNNINNDFIIINEEMTNITIEEIKLLENLLNKHHNRVIFLQHLNEFRSTAKLMVPKKLTKTMGKLFNIILDTVKKDKDIHSGKNVVLLSQTYYYINKGQKEYLQEFVIEHNIFKDLKFWEELLDMEINKEFKRQMTILENRYNKDKNDNKDNQDNKENRIEINENKRENLIFSQIVSISDNMISFGLNKDQIYQIIDPNIKSYKISQDTIDNIKNIIDSRFIDENKEKSIEDIKGEKIEIKKEEKIEEVEEVKVEEGKKEKIDDEK